MGRSDENPVPKIAREGEEDGSLMKVVMAMVTAMVVIVVMAI